ncbi:putative RNA recognition motif domain, nucleotide-binding alpha-beta plait domain superfamily [Helianthus annuus]|nr:putative RNA recognition motif domain, nucleotide-binding alpha-beta plait domain superfamily [Helianthus annuus]KAJ0661634.1 putative RNA recognition motif domain, nucleotide-binding alpha-beta plait domain superfamily [Helianthus annuus]KAJ0855868.1 putative RNA recognition motif domain, nucleotide-binding alpha-beta plait domain superfamily [Helianthus annuus]
MDDRKEGDVTKFFVSRLPERCSSKDVAEALLPFGSIQGVYIAKKRDKNGYRFGFASFKGVKDAAELEKQMRNIWIGSYRLFINVARFAKENDTGGVYRDNEEKKKGQRLNDQGERHQFFKEQEVFRGRSFVNKGISFADTVSGKSQGAGSEKEVTVSEYAKAYVEMHDKAIVGKMKDLWNLRKLDILLKEANFGDAVIKYLGGLNVMVVFRSSVEADNFRANSPGFGWFASVEIWKGQAIAFERLAWLNIHGVPLHLSGNETYDSVGRVFGKVIHASQRQSEDNILTYDCVYVLTDTVKRIEEVVVIIEKGKRFRIWVEEERGDWLPDSVEKQDTCSVDSDGWDLMSESEKTNKKKKGSEAREPLAEEASSMGGDRSSEFGDIDNLAAKENGVSRETEDYRNTELPVKATSEVQVQWCPTSFVNSGIGAGRTSVETGVNEKANVINEEGFQSKEKGNLVDIEQMEVGVNLGSPRWFEKDQWLNEGRQRKKKDYVGGDEDNSLCQNGFNVNLNSSGLSKKGKKGRKPIIKKTLVEEDGDFMRPRKRLRDNDPFDLNETIGIQEDSDTREQQENSVDNVMGSAGGLDKQQEESSGIRKEVEEEVVEDLNLKPTEEAEENINVELNITSVMGGLLGVDLQNHELLIKEVIREEGIQKGDR